MRSIGAQHPEWHREQIAEHVRQEEFPHLPSRLDCIFFFSTEAAANFYKAALPANGFLLLYEVELLDPTTPEHEADWKGTGPYLDDNEWARRYWRGDVMPDRPLAPGELCRETLAVTSLRILRRFLPNASIGIANKIK
jgi:hypothetical protein